MKVNQGFCSVAPSMDFLEFSKLEGLSTLTEGQAERYSSLNTIIFCDNRKSFLSENQPYTQ